MVNPNITAFPAFTSDVVSSTEVRQLIQALELRFQGIEGEVANIDVATANETLDGTYAPLGHTHVESDITDLQNYLININSESIFDLQDVSSAGQTAGHVLTWDGAQMALQAVSGSGLNNIVEDTTPQLGGALDSNSFDIDVTNGNQLNCSLIRPSPGNSLINLEFGIGSNIRFDSVDTGNVWNFGSTNTTTSTWLIINPPGPAAGLTIRDDTGVDSGNFFHDGTDFNTSFSNTTDWNLLSGIVFKIFDSGATDSANFSHDGTDFNTGFTNTTDWNLLDGIVLKIFDSGDTDSANFSHDGTDFNTGFTNTADWNITDARIVTPASTTAKAGLNIPEGTAPSSPVDGDIWVTTTDILARINGVSESLLGGGGARTFVFKSADETVNNSQTFQDDDHITGINLTANKWYALNGYLEVESNTTADWKAIWVFSQTPQNAGSWSVDGHGSNQAETGDTGLGLTAAVQPIWSGTWVGLHVRGYFQSNASTGGTLKLQWAQNTATVVDTIVGVGSWITLEEMD